MSEMLNLVEVFWFASTLRHIDGYNIRLINLPVPTLWEVFC
jgi:hypothetical protein